VKTNIDEPCAGNLQARFFRGSCSNKTQKRGVKLQLLPKKLLTLIAMLPAISLSGTCFGVDSIEEDKIFILYGSTRFLSFAYALGYHYTNSTQVSIGPS